jgi:galactokinase
MGPVRINKGCHVKCGSDINFVGVCGRVGVRNSGGEWEGCNVHLLCNVGLHNLQVRVHPGQESLNVYLPRVVGQ